MKRRFEIDVLGSLGQARWGSRRPKKLAGLSPQSRFVFAGETAIHYVRYCTKFMPKLFPLTQPKTEHVEMYLLLLSSTAYSDVGWFVTEQVMVMFCAAESTTDGQAVAIKLRWVDCYRQGRFCPSQSCHTNVKNCWADENASAAKTLFHAV